MLRVLLVCSIFALATSEDIDLHTLEMIKSHPSHLLTVLIGECKKFPEICPKSVQSTASYISNTVEVLLNFDDQIDEKMIRDIEHFAEDLYQCKDATCLMDFEIENGLKLEKILRKVAHLLSFFPESEKFAWERSILKPPAFIKRFSN